MASHAIPYFFPYCLIFFLVSKISKTLLNVGINCLRSEVFKLESGQHLILIQNFERIKWAPPLVKKSVKYFRANFRDKLWKSGTILDQSNVFREN